MKKLILLFVSVALIFLSCEIPEDDNVYDSISILDVEYYGNLSDRYVNTFEIKVKYELLTQAQGIIKFYFNDGDSSDKIIHRGGSFNVTKGSAEQVFTVTATPTKWPDSKFKIMVIMFANDIGVATDEISLEVN
jgi:hypothetical protein